MWIAGWGGSPQLNKLVQVCSGRMGIPLYEQTDRHTRLKTLTFLKFVGERKIIAAYICVALLTLRTVLVCEENEPRFRSRHKSYLGIRASFLP